MGFLADILKDLPTVGVARERIALVEQKYELLERENEVLKHENARLKSELDAMRRQVPSTEWVEARGVLFKRKSDGKFEPDAYCPDCKRALSGAAMHDLYFPQSCSKCGFTAPFLKDETSAILAELGK